MTSLFILALATVAKAAIVKRAPPVYTDNYTYDPNNPNGLPVTWQPGQEGTNRCGGGDSPTSMCQNAFINSITDFCLYGPPYSNGHNATVGETERIEVAYCLKSGYGTRLFPPGTITGAHWVQTPDYVQITGFGDFTKIGIPKGDTGGELDPHGADGNGNPIGGLVFGNSYGTMLQYHEWTNYMAVDEFCFRACKPDGKNPQGNCQHVYDVMGCEWVMPANYDIGYFDSCQGDTGEPMGVYGTSTFHQGDGNTPQAHPKPATSNCVRVASLSDWTAAPTTTVPGVTISSSTSVALSTSGTHVYTLLLTGAVTIPTATATSTASTSSGAAGSSSTKNAASRNGAPSLLGALAAGVLGLLAL